MEDLNNNKSHLVGFSQQPEPVVNSQPPSPIRCFLNALSRRKPLDCRTETTLNRCLSFLDLTSLGVGSTLGLGLYVLTGQVASTKAGPAVVVSFALAALASAFSAICYAEFAGRVPRAGSAYAYSYICVGEFVAFIIGWNLVLEYVIGASSVAKGFSGYLYRIYHNIMGDNGTKFVGTNSGFNSSVAMVSTTTMAPTTTMMPPESLRQSVYDYLYETFDPIAVCAVLIVTLLIVFGVKGSTKVTICLTVLNLSVVSFVVASGVGSVDLKYWRLDKSEVPRGYGNGGFIPYGWSGILAGSGSCFFGFVGFDTIASSAEEAKNPKRTVPVSILLSLLISFLAYMSLSIVQTLLWPYYDQGRDTILPHIFQELNMPITHWVVLLGAVSGLSSALLAGMYPLPRILYSMSHDKLIYGYLSKVSSSVKLPLRSVIFGSVLVASLACVLDLEELADMMSIGTLFAYTLVSLSVLIIRYEDRRDTADDATDLNNHLEVSDIIETNLKRRSIDPVLGSSSGSTWAAMAKNSESPPVKTKLAPKHSTPIREKGSRALAPQLSIGFQSWFKSSHSESHQDAIDEDENENQDFGQVASCKDDLKWTIKRLILNQTGDNPLPDDQSSRLAKILITILVALCVLLDVAAMFLSRWLDSEDPARASSFAATLTRPSTLILSSIVGLSVMLIMALVLLSRLPTSRRLSEDMFMVPWVPVIPTLSVLVNVLLMLNLGYLTWMRFSVWMAVGLFIYFTYGIWNSEGFLYYSER